jgi:protein TonB
MSVEERSEREEFGALGGCFVGGDAEQRRRERRVKRRALAISITVQALVLAAIILLPLFGKTERIVLAYAVPIPPYSPYAPHQQPQSAPQAPAPSNECRFCPPKAIPQTIVTRDDRRSGSDEVPVPGELLPVGPAIPGGIPIDDGRRRVPPPPPSDTPSIVHVTHLDPAMLRQRVEPVYPRLAIQMRREGRVELHAIIGTDGTIQELQVVSGDIVFYESAKAAVSQWRYKPTYLNNQPVRVDTTITVIYTLAH